MDDKQKKNLRKLIKFAKTLPDDYEINMRAFRQNKDEDTRSYRSTLVPKEKKLSCGTVACFAGLAPLAGLPPHKNENWGVYVARCFGADGDTFAWLFSAWWTDIDNTLSGAVARAEWYLEKGLPEDYPAQIHGAAPLCYRTAQ